MHQFAVRLKEVEISELGSPHPLDGLEHLIADRPTKASDREENHFDIPIRVPVTYAKDLLPYFGLDHQFLSELATQRGFQVFTVFHLASGKFPLHSVSVRMMTLADQDKVAIYYDAGGDEDGFLFSHKGTLFYQRMRWLRCQAHAQRSMNPNSELGVVGTRHTASSLVPVCSR